MRIAKVLSKPVRVETIASGQGVDILKWLVKRHGPGRWRKLKGQARVELEGGEICWAEVHWYEAHGIGKTDMKVKRVLRA